METETPSFINLPQLRQVVRRGREKHRVSRAIVGALSEYCVRPNASIREAIAQIDVNRRGIVLVVNQRRRLIGTITDGDVRRAILANVDLGESVTALLGRKAGTHFATPITAPPGKDQATYLRLLKQHNVLQLPVVDERHRVVGLITMDELLPDQHLPIQAVVMAGGRGSRLHPLTEDMPKPMLPIGDRPLLEIIIRQLREAGIKQVKVTTHHKANKITEYFGNGSDFGVQLSCVEEDRPLGTIGGLGLLAVPKETTLVMNGDILTHVDFRAMVAYHNEHRAELTIAVRHYEITVPYGVVECEGFTVRRLNEKPTFGAFVNAGIYLLEPAIYRLIPHGQRFDMTELIHRAVELGHAVVSFPIREYWLDIGQIEDYEQAKAHAKQWQSA